MRDHVAKIIIKVSCITEQAFFIFKILDMILFVRQKRTFWNTGHGHGRKTRINIFLQPEVTDENRNTAWNKAKTVRF